MKIFPAIDIKDKKCVRLVKGNFDNKTEYKTSPIDQAGKYKDHGFKNLHIVDLDGALTGETVNLDIIEEIVSKFDLKIEIGGGVRTFKSIEFSDNIDPIVFLNNLKLVLSATHLGDTRTLALPVATTIFHENGAQARTDMGVSDTLIRISVGIENIDDLIDDFKQAFKALL